MKPVLLLLFIGLWATFSNIHAQDRIFAEPVIHAAGSFPRDIVSKDFNNDGEPDVAVVLSGADAILVLLKTGDGQFTVSDSCVAGTYPVSIYAGLLNQDAFVDLVCANNGSDDISVFLGHGDGQFDVPVT